MYLHICACSNKADLQQTPTQATRVIASNREDCCCTCNVTVQPLQPAIPLHLPPILNTRCHQSLPKPTLYTTPAPLPRCTFVSLPLSSPSTPPRFPFHASLSHAAPTTSLPPFPFAELRAPLVYHIHESLISSRFALQHGMGIRSVSRLEILRYWESLGRRCRCMLWTPWWVIAARGGGERLVVVEVEGEGHGGVWGLW